LKTTKPPATDQIEAVMNRSQFAKLTGLSTGAISAKRDAGLVVCVKGSSKQGSKMQIDVAPSLRNLFAERVSRHSPDHDRITAARAAKLERENQLAVGQLIDANELQNDLLRAISFLAQAFDSLPQRVTTDELLQAKIEEEIRLARNEFADSLNRMGGGRAT
jgi:phage terminase Nu1 subunit (DNA packaging protein)